MQDSRMQAECFNKYEKRMVLISRIILFTWSFHPGGLLNFKDKDNCSECMGNQSDNREEVHEGSKNSKETAKDRLIFRPGNVQYARMPQSY